MVAQEQITKQPILHTGCAQPYVAIPAQLTLNELHKLGALASELTQWLACQGALVTGPLFYRYLTVDYIDKSYNLEVGFPIAERAPGNGHVIAGTIPDGTFATLVHCGHPNDISSTYSSLYNWAVGQGLQFKMHHDDEGEHWAGRFEFHLTEPAGRFNTHDCRTAVALLLA